MLWSKRKWKKVLSVELSPYVPAVAPQGITWVVGDPEFLRGLVVVAISPPVRETREGGDCPSCFYEMETITWTLYGKIDGGTVAARLVVTLTREDAGLGESHTKTITLEVRSASRRELARALDRGSVKPVTPTPVTQLLRNLGLNPEGILRSIASGDKSPPLRALLLTGDGEGGEEYVLL